MTSNLNSETLIPVVSAEEPVVAERWADLLRSHGIHVALQSHGVGAVDLLSQPAGAWWELRVPESELPRARALLEADAAAVPA